MDTVIVKPGFVVYRRDYNGGRITRLSTHTTINAAKREAVYLKMEGGSGEIMIDPVNDIDDIENYRNSMN